MGHYVYTLEIGLTGQYYELGKFTSREQVDEIYYYLVNKFASELDVDKLKPTITRLMLSSRYEGDRPSNIPLAGALMHDFKEDVHDAIIEAYNEKYK